METAKTVEILKVLAEGIDPGTGEQFPAGSTYQQPDTVRALFSAIRMLENPASTISSDPPSTKQPGAMTAGKSAPQNAGRPWSEEEDTRLGQTFDSGKSIEELAEIHKRSKWAIEARLARLGKIPEPPSRFPARNNSAGNAATAQ
jgi:O-methyltransferase involved in polyketide biosynthesis